MQDPSRADQKTPPSISKGRRQQITLTQTRQVPSPLRLARYQRAPEIGPKILFFSGGSALRKTSRVLTEYTHNSVHLITPFDSGGSSAKLRDAFPMISVGDLRNRLMALADTRLLGHPEVYQLFDTRLVDHDDQALLRARLDTMVSGQDPLVAAVPMPLRKLIRNHLGYFREHMPSSFDLRGASVGNLILAGGYLNNRSDIDAVIFLFSKLVAVRGIVRPVVDSNLHLCAQLEDGTLVAGQHEITSRQTPLSAPIRALRLTEAIDELGGPEAVAEIDDRTTQLIDEAELICFPIGSFWTSVMACLLPRGVGAAVARAGCPKVYVPNCGDDPEELGLAPHDQVRVLLEQLRRDAGEDTPTELLLHFVLVDSERGEYAGGLDVDAIEAHGVEVIDTPLINDETAPLLEPRRLVELLLSLI
ncbi:GAK system CofD-like protein [Enhygromyxa salina]|uniref:Gluconeogenesis factor n=1 Tax=Enhygromyxa salina TaxID=215803 RepID=A0A2S9XS52_9BACT|nr:GAK system CofD-like protein [Enhygromyxa salina]PRP95688.1 Gluconeogenesis factor [Enhygromyxa salina]